MHRCPVCPKCFPSPYKLKRHYLIHTGQKPFMCKVCRKAFTQAGHLRKHVHHVHDLQSPKECERDGFLNRHQTNCDKPAAGVSTQGKSSCNRQLSAVATSKMPRANDGTLIQSGIANVVPVLQEQVEPANVYTPARTGHNGNTCKICLRSFSSSHHLWIHSETHSRPQQLERSSESVQTFPKMANTSMHLGLPNLASSESKTPLKHQCHKCLKSFCSPSKLQRHFLIHTGQKPYSCTVCRKAFRQKVHLKSHLSMSNKCSLSGGMMREKQRLFNGIQTLDLQPQSSLEQQPLHFTPVNSSVELELQCKISVQGLSETEIKSDAGVKPEQPLNANASSKLYQQKQQCRKHEGLKRFQCEICGRSFRLEINLLRHHTIHQHQTELESLIPVQNSNSVKTYNSEARKHSIEPSNADPITTNIVVKPEAWMEICGNYSGFLHQDANLITSGEQQRQINHVASKQQINTLHQCCFCSKCFPSASKLQRHLMIHTGQRPFGCEICGKKFRQKTHLRVHCRTHLWSKYHKQRSFYINRPPSRIGGFNTRMAGDVQAQGMSVQRKDFQTSAAVVSIQHRDWTTPVSVQSKDNREPENKLLQHALKKNTVVSMTKVSRVTVKKKQTQNPGNIPHKCFLCLKCFPSASKLQRHEMVHTGMKPFHCPVCGKAFRQTSHLKAHQRTHYKGNLSNPLSQQENIRKLKAANERKLFPRIAVCVPAQKKSVNTVPQLSNFEVVRNGVNELPCSRHGKSITEVKTLLKTNSKRTVSCKKGKLHVCRICSKNFTSPYKLTRHLVTHSGIRPYRCTSCSKSFTQKGHLKLHEQRCRQSDTISDYIQNEMINASYLPEKCTENFTDCTDLNTREEIKPLYASVAHSFEATDTYWLADPEVGLKVENNESEKKKRENNQTTNHCSNSFSSGLAFEIAKLSQNQNMPFPLFHENENNAHDGEILCQTKGVTVILDTSKMLSDTFVSSVAENQILPDNSWCAPVSAFECDKCATSFLSEKDLKQHICTNSVKMVGSAQRNDCDICFKKFVSPSKLARHYVVHTGLRPFRCDICGKTFTQSTHVRKHKLTHC